MQDNDMRKPVPPKEAIEIASIFKQLPEIAKASLIGYGNGLLDGIAIKKSGKPRGPKKKPA